MKRHWLAIAVWLPLSVGLPVAAQRVDTTGLPYPRAFFFRQSEWAHHRIERAQLSYDEWDRTFSRLGGIMGKTLDEEIPGRSANAAHFSRFKKAHPEQLVLLHYNGNARDPRDRTPGFWAGHWIYFTGCRVTRDVPTADGECEIGVENPDLFQVDMGRYRDKNEDVGICMLDGSGRPDWHRSEQLQLVSIDRKRKVLRVRRGCFGTEPRTFPAGRAYVAAHVTEGPWGHRNNLMWYYNYSTHCPRDKDGRSCVDVLVDDVARRFANGGELAAYDGLEFDVMHHEHGGGPPRGERRALDMDADGMADNGWIDGVNTYGAGVVEFCRRLRAKMGDAPLIMADGMSAKNQRAFGYLNGIESEGWPTLGDWEIRDWSGGMNRHRYWAASGRAPVFNYINHKYTMAGEKPGQRVRPDVPFSMHRLVLAVAQCVDAAVTYSYLPPSQPGERIGLWDELCQGREGRVGWLGFPRGETINLAKRSPDLLAGKGRRMGAGFTKRCSGEGIAFAADGDTLNVTQGDSGAPRMRFRVAGIPAAGRHLVVSATMRAAPLRGCPPGVPRLVRVGTPGPWLVGREPPVSGMCVRGGREEAIRPESGAGVRYTGGKRLDGEEHAAFLCHPPYKGGVGYTFWERTLRVPGRGVLTFHTGTSEKAPGRSDGVTYRVIVMAENGRKTVFDRHVTEWRWLKHTVSLAPWAGRQVTLRFVSDCGPRDNCTTDHASWGDVWVAAAGSPEPSRLPRSFMTFAGPEWFVSTFYFRDVRTGVVDLDFEVEGNGAFWVRDLTAHAHPETLLREFDHGLVLANPSPEPFTFDLSALVPGRAFRRLVARKRQDAATNNGARVGKTVRLGARDGLFLVEDDTAGRAGD